MQIGILGNEGSWYVERLCGAAKARGHMACELRFPEQSPKILNGTTTLKIGEVDAENLDSVIVRTMPPGSLEQVITRMNFLNVAADLGVDIVNSPRSIECAVDKYLTTQKLCLNGVPVPDTITCEDSDTAMEAFTSLGGDVVVKPLFGAEGRGVLRVDHPEIALRVFRTLERLNAVLYLQAYVDGPNEDIRVLMLDGRMIGGMKRIAPDGDFRANVAQAGKAVAWQPTDREVSLAEAAAAATGCLFCGVDLMYNSAREPFVIEVNAVPGWRALQTVSRIDVADLLIRVLETRQDDFLHRAQT